jgi:hypothetical protein
MLPNETQRMKRMGKVFGYFNHQLLDQSELVFSRRAKRYIKSFSEWCTSNMEILQGQISVFKTLNTNLCKLFAQLPEIRKIGVKK